MTQSIIDMGKYLQEWVKLNGLEAEHLEHFL
jgi:hypothetical protein